MADRLRVLIKVEKGEKEEAEPRYLGKLASGFLYSYLGCSADVNLDSNAEGLYNNSEAEEEEEEEAVYN